MSDYEAWFWFFFLPMVVMIAGIFYLWCLSIEDWPPPGTE